MRVSWNGPLRGCCCKPWRGACRRSLRSLASLRISTTTKHLDETVPDSTVVALTSIIGMEVDTEKVKIFKLVCQFTTRHVSGSPSESLLRLTWQNTSKEATRFTGTQDGKHIGDRCAGSCRTELSNFHDVIFYFMDKHGDRVWVASPAALRAFFEYNEVLPEGADLKLFACSADIV